MSMLARIRARLADERGFTLIELMVGCVIGIMIILAADTLLDTSITLTGRVSDRVDSAARGRLAMSQITRELRSQVCFQDSSGNPQPSITDGEDYILTFYNYLPKLGSAPHAPSQFSSYTPQKVTLKWEPPGNTDGAPGNSITEKDYTGTGTAPNIVWPTNPTSSTTLLQNVVPLQNSQNQSLPVFVYYKYNSATGTPTTQLSTPLSAADEANVAAVDVQFVVRANNRSDNQQATTLDETAFIPGWNPNTPGGASPPQCV